MIGYDHAAQVGDKFKLFVIANQLANLPQHLCINAKTCSNFSRLSAKNPRNACVAGISDRTGGIVGRGGGDYTAGVKLFGS